MFEAPNQSLIAVQFNNKLFVSLLTFAHNLLAPSVQAFGECQQCAPVLLLISLVGETLNTPISLSSRSDRANTAPRS
jgi:hypothetical protein